MRAVWFTPSLTLSSERHLKLLNHFPPKVISSQGFDDGPCGFGPVVLVPLTQLHFITRRTLGRRSQKPPWVQDIEDPYRGHHQRSIQHDEVNLVRDQEPAPPLQELHRAVYAPGIDHRNAETGRRDQELQFAGQNLAPDALQEDEEKVCEDGDGGELEDYPRDHGVGARFGVAVDFAGGLRGEAAADSLDD